MMGFSGWNIMANLAETLSLQGLLVLLNLFFAPYVVAAQAIANQVSNAIMQFVNNFRTAINPQIIKLYAAEERSESKKLTLETTVYCFDLVLLLGFPAITVMDKLMTIWLVEVPPYAVIFTQSIIVRQILGTFNASFYIPMMAANKMRINSISSAISGIGSFIILYILFKLGFSPMWVQYIGVIGILLFSLIIKPYVLYKDIDYSIKEMLLCFWKCAKVLLLTCLLSLPTIALGDNLIHTIAKILIAFFAVMIASYVVLEKEMRKKCKVVLKNRIRI
jgi:O-antigen/teichoic acid export membrane protein